MNLEIICFNNTRELQFTDEVVKALALPEKECWHPLNIPVDRLDPRFEYRWKAYAISEKTKYETDAAQNQVIENLQLSIMDGWMPVESLQYPFLLTPSIRKFSTGRFLRYNGLLLCCKHKPLMLGVEMLYIGGANEAISFSTPLSTGKQINSLCD